MIHGIKKSTTSIGAQAAPTGHRGPGRVHQASGLRPCPPGIGAQAVSTSSHGEASAQSRSSAPGACHRGHRSPGVHL